MTSNDPSQPRPQDGKDSSKTKPDFWTTETYSQKVAPFVAKLTTKVVDMLNPQADDTLLDLGCGDGLLTAALAERCQSVVGIDASSNMIASMQQRFPGIPAFVLDCGADLLPRVQQQHAGSRGPSAAAAAAAAAASPSSVADALHPGTYSALFSNAALHWILRDASARAPFFAACAALLRPGGRIVAEAGGFGNVSEVRLALVHELVHGGYGVTRDQVRAVDPWWFGSVEDYRALVQHAGLEWVHGELELRQTKLTDGPEGGAKGWMALFGTPFASILPGGVEGDAWQRVLANAAASVEYVGRHPDDGVLVNYVRVRFEARKPK